MVASQHTGYPAVVRRWVGCGLAAMAVSGCCKAPQDPDDPADSKPARAALEFLEVISARDDAKAWEMTAPIYQARRTRELFSQRLDSFEVLRSFEEVEFTRVHYITREDHNEQELFARCVGRAVQNVEIDATLVDAEGRTTTVNLNAHRIPGSWTFKGIDVDGQPLMPTRPPPTNPNFVPPKSRPTPAPPPSTPPAPAAPPEPPNVALDGPWTIHPYFIEVTPPPQAWLARYEAAFGLTLGLGAPDRIGMARSKIRINTNCDGGCRPGSFDERIAGSRADSVLKNLGHDMGTSSWTQRPTRRADGSWWMHAQGRDDKGNTRDRVLHAFAAADNDGHWLECQIDVAKEELGRLDELSRWCQELKWSYDDAARRPVEPRFESKFELRGQSLRLPTPSGFSFVRYDPMLGEVTFKGTRNVLDSFSIRTGCGGTCSPEHLRKNLDKSIQKRLEQLREDGRQPHEEVPVTEVDGLILHRVRYRAFDKASLDVRVVAIPNGAFRYLQCEVQLIGDAIERADELQSHCKSALKSLAARPSQ